MMCFNNRYRGDTQLLKQYVEGGDLGEIYFAKTGWVRRRGIPGLGGWFTTKSKSGGGPLIDLGVHMIDVTMWLMGNPEPTTVSGATYTEFGDKAAKASGGTYDVEDLAAGFVRFANGASMLFEASWASNVREERTYSEILGSKGGAELSPLTIFTEQHGALVDIQPKFRSIGGHEAAIAHFVDCILNGTQPISPGEDGVKMMKILDALYQSAEAGKEVQIQ
jgi:predicted dehydrogenase